MFKHTKKALLLSVISLLLCCTMLVGTTFAWFTDSISSGVNMIASGNLDVDMKYGKVANGQISGWNDVAGAENLFDPNALWEPGRVEVVYLQVNNLGTLQLNYQLNVKVNEETPAKNVDDTEFKLSDHLVFKVVEMDDSLTTYTDRQAVAAAAGTALGLKDYNGQTTKLEPNGIDYVALIVYMPESVGNEANYRGSRPEIKLGVELLATQVDHETDSFGPDYDAGLSPLKDGEVLIEKGGAQYVTNAAGTTYLYVIPADYAEDTFTVAPGTAAIGNYAFAYNGNVDTVILPTSVTSLGRGFDSSSVKKVVLNEGLQQIDSRAFRSTSALEEVQISSTVKVIADNAFQKSSIKTITIPATVETIGETAFGSSKVETVIIEGNTSIQGYAFRGCTQLRTVYLNGDDVTFIPSTLNNRNNCWFCNGESNNPNTSNITFHVKNEVVAARLRAALGAENPATTPIYINGVLYQP